MLVLNAVLCDGSVRPFAPPLALTLSRSMEMPCDGLTVSLSGGEAVDEIAEVALYDGRERLFCGIVDRQRCEHDANKTALWLECRSRHALLLDNEAVPRTHYYTRLSGVVRSHAAEFGICGVRGEDPYLSRFAVYKGFSVWRVIELFCRQTLRRVPRVTADGYLDTGPWRPQRTLVLSNRQPGAQRYLSAVREINRCEVVSSVRVQTQNGRYGAPAENKEAAGVLRRRLLVPSGEWANLPSRGAQEIIRESMRAKHMVRVTLPGIVRCDPGDAVVLRDQASYGTALRVGELEIHADANNTRTELALYDGQYL